MKTGGDILFSPRDIEKATGGRFEKLSAGAAAEIREVVIDSREAGRDSLFVPLKGDRTDGHEFIADVCAKGAILSLVSNDWWAARKNELESCSKNTGFAGFVVVPDTLKALADLAAWHVERVKGPVRIGITGSSGKTTCKEILGSILEIENPVCISKGNLNSEIGLPLSVFNLMGEHAFGVFEMGINHPGEMSELARVLRPGIGIITNIGTAHIGMLGSRESIAREKKQIFRYFTNDSTGFLPGDCPYNNILMEGTPSCFEFFGEKSTYGYEGYKDNGLDGQLLFIGGVDMKFPLVGRFNRLNALAAVSAALHIGVDIMTIKKGLERIKPLFGRGEIVRGPVTILKDCYNANPEAVHEILGFVKELAWTSGRKFAVLGDMLELGDESARLHAEVGSKAAWAGLDGIVFVGGESKAAYQKTIEECGSCRAVHVDTAEEAGDFLASSLRQGDFVVLKASRGIRLEKTAERVMERKFVNTAGQGERVSS